MLNNAKHQYIFAQTFFALMLVISTCITSCATQPDGKPINVGGKTAYEVFADKGLASLAQAAASGNVDEVDRLIAKGVLVDGTGDKGATPLMFAMLANSPKGMEALLKHKANPNHRQSNLGLLPGTPIVMLLADADVRYTPLLEILLKHGADPNSRFPVSPKTCQSFPYEGDTLLKRSIMNFTQVKLLVEHGADVNLIPQHSRSLAASAAGLGQFDVLEYLLDHGVNKTDLDDIAYELQARTWVPEWQSRRLKILEKLNAMGAKIYASEWNLDTPLRLLSSGEWKYKGRYTGDKVMPMPDACKDVPQAGRKHY